MPMWLQLLRYCICLAKQVMMYNLPDGRAIDLADVTLNKQLQGGSIIE